MTPWWIALQFLTRLPVTLAGMPTPEQNGRSLLFYPLVGLLIGLLLYGAQLLLGDTAVLLQAALVLTLWVGISGGLHLDGLADSADAWVGGLGDKQRTLEIMKDPRSGPIAVVVLVLLLLLKFSALVTLLESGAGLWLLLVPWLARALLPLLFLSTPYVRAGGLGQALASHLPRRQLPWVLAAHVLAMLLFGWPALLAVPVAGVV
jgi:adenosylcobinamide-GDP ribazoletransferase